MIITTFIASIIFATIGGLIAFGIAISMMINSLVNCIMRLWARFIRNLYKDESYLTHTLPVPRKTIYLSKIISALICIFTTTLVIALCLFICYYSEANIEMLKYEIKIEG